MARPFCTQGVGFRSGFPARVLLAIAVAVFGVTWGGNQTAESQEPGGSQKTTPTQEKVNRQGKPSAEWTPPEPPEAFRELLKRGQVEFEFYDPAREERQWPGVTHFSLDFKYRSQNRHAFDTNRGEFVVTPSLSRVEITMRHRVELPINRQTPDFWEDSMVRHEMDHVRISSHPVWRRLFESRLREIRRLTRPGNPAALGESPKAVAERLVDDAVRQAFNETLQQIDIRYKELDRVTSHGVDELPQDFWSNGLESP